MAKRLFLLLLLFGSIGALAIAQTSSQGIENQQDSDDSDDEDNYDEGYYYDGVVWNGPGYYYGVWFSTEAALNGWRRDHYWRGDRGGERSFGGGGFRGGRGGGRR